MPTEAAARSLIVNADDLGLHVDLNRGVEEAHVGGIVASASLSAVGEAFDDAVELCRRCPDLDVGVHLTLVEERPLTDPSGLGALVDGDRFVASHRALVPVALAGRVPSGALARELEAQIARVRKAGIAPSHLDAHQHVHLLPGIWPVVVGLARRHGIPWVRVPRFTPLRTPGATAGDVALRVGLNVLRRLRWRDLGPLRSPQLTPALAWSGHLTVERILVGLREVPPGTLAELVTHPGFNTDALRARYDWGYDWSGETQALREPDLPAALADAGFALRSFRELDPSRAERA